MMGVWVLKWEPFKRSQQMSRLRSGACPQNNRADKPVSDFSWHPAHRRGKAVHTLQWTGSDGNLGCHYLGWFLFWMPFITCQSVRVIACFMRLKVATSLLYCLKLWLVWWHVPVVPAIGRLRWEDRHDFRASLDYILRASIKMNNIVMLCKIRLSIV